MTTHTIQIRRKEDRIPASGGWMPLTSKAMSSQEAYDLAAYIGPEWEARVVPFGASSPRSALSTSEVIERLDTVVDLPPTIHERADAELGDLVADLLPYVRVHLFQALESLHDSPDVFDRWRTQDHRLEHRPRCNGGKAKWSTGPLGELAGMAWLAVRELERRVDHLNKQTIPALGLVATARVLPPTLRTGQCQKCSAHASAVSVTVEIVWEGHVMRREYALGRR